MAYIAPDSIIRILRNVALDNTYKDTILFDRTANQTTYFTNKAKYSANDIITLQNKTYHIVWSGGSNYCLLIDITNEVEEKPSIEGGSTIQ